MKDRQLVDLLDEHSCALGEPGPDADWQARLPEMALALVPLLLLAQEVAALFAPVRPRPEYRGNLHQSLVTEARRRQAQRILELPERRLNGQIRAEQGLPDRVWGWISQETNVLPVDRRWVWGAAAVGSAVSLAGIVAYVLARRGHPAASA